MSSEFKVSESICRRAVKRAHSRLDATKDYFPMFWNRYNYNTIGINLGKGFISMLSGICSIARIEQMQLVNIGNNNGLCPDLELLACEALGLMMKFDNKNIIDDIFFEFKIWLEQRGDGGFTWGNVVADNDQVNVIALPLPKDSWAL